MHTTPACFFPSILFPPYITTRSVGLHPLYSYVSVSAFKRRIVVLGEEKKLGMQVQPKRAFMDKIGSHLDSVLREDDIDDLGNVVDSS